MSRCLPARRQQDQNQVFLSPALHTGQHPLSCSEAIWRAPEKEFYNVKLKTPSQFLTKARWTTRLFILSWLASPKGAIFTPCLQQRAKNAAVQVWRSSGEWKTHLALEQKNQTDEENNLSISSQINFSALNKVWAALMFQDKSVF